MAVLLTLTALVFASDDWGVVASVFGGVGSWAPWMKKSTRDMVLSLCGTVWRRFILAFLAWPFPLVRVADPNVLRADKIIIVCQLFALSLCCLDAYFSAKIRALADDPEDLLLPDWQEFLFHAFNKMVLANARLETDFAHFKQWIIKSLKPLSVPHVQAKHVCSAFLNSYRKDDVDPEREPEVEAKRTKMSRPSWAIKLREEGRSTARHTFIGNYIRRRMNIYIYIYIYYTQVVSLR